MTKKSEIFDLYTIFEAKLILKYKYICVIFLCHVLIKI